MSQGQNICQSQRVYLGIRSSFSSVILSYKLILAIPSQKEERLVFKLKKSQGKTVSLQFLSQIFEAE